MATKKSTTTSKKTKAKSAATTAKKVTTSESTKFGNLRYNLNSSVTVLRSTLDTIATRLDTVYDTAMDAITMRDFDANQDLATYKENLSKLEIDLTGVGGVPPLHNHSADLEFRVAESGGFVTIKNAHYGAFYGEHVLRKGAFVSIVPGRPSLAKIDDKKKIALLDASGGTNSELGDKTEGATKDKKETTVVSAIDNIAATLQSFELLEFQYDPTTFWRQVAVAMEMAAGFLGIYNIVQKQILRVKRLGPLTEWDKLYNSSDVSWANQVGNGSNDRWMNYINFYHDGPIESNSDFNNSVGDTFLSGIANNSLNEAGKDMIFLDSAAFHKAASENNKDSGFIDKVIGTANKLAFNMKMPQAWKDFSYTNNMQFKFRFTVPYGNALAFYLHIYYHIMKLVILATTIEKKIADITIGSTPPFAIRAFCRGAMACNIGMITNLTIDKNVESFAEGMFPTDVTVTMTIADLYPMMHLPLHATAHDLTRSYGYAAFVSSLCGFNIDALTVAELANIKAKSLVDTVKNKLDVKAKLARALTNKITSTRTMLRKYLS